jgi:hypothetical protein
MAFCTMASVLSESEGLTGLCPINRKRSTGLGVLTASMNHCSFVRFAAVMTWVQFVLPREVVQDTKCHDSQSKWSCEIAIFLTNVLKFACGVVQDLHIRGHIHFHHSSC